MIFEPLFEIERQVCKFLENNLLVYISKYRQQYSSKWIMLCISKDDPIVVVFKHDCTN